MAAPMVHVEYQQSDSGSDADREQSDDNDEAAEDETPAEKHGLADVMAKILHKNVPVHKQVILAKGQTDKEIKKRKLAAEEKAEDGKKGKIEEKRETTADIALQEKKKVWENICRVKPNILEREKERQLQRIATRGVVQLFNAVRKQQKTVEGELEMAGSDRKKEKVMEKMTKHKFLNMLKGTSNVEIEKKESKEKQAETKQQDQEKEKKWSILRDDYMMGAKMKDWNKESSDENDNGPGDPDISDSD